MDKEENLSNFFENDNEFKNDEYFEALILYLALGRNEEKIKELTKELLKPENIGKTRKGLVEFKESLKLQKINKEESLKTQEFEEDPLMKEIFQKLVDECYSDRAKKLEENKYFNSFLYFKEKDIDARKKLKSELLEPTEIEKTEIEFEKFIREIIRLVKKTPNAKPIHTGYSISISGNKTNP